MVDIGDRGVVTISSFSNQFIPASTPDVGDRVIVIPMNDGSKFCIPCLQFSIGDWVWVGPEFKFSGFNWKLDANLQLIPLTTTKSWVQQTAGAEWAGRYGHSVVALSDGSIVLMGGWTGIPKNDTWRSTDKGVTWVQQSASAGWTARYHHTSVALPDGSIVLMGGIGGGYKNDVWRSTDKGVTWVQQSASAGWTARYDHSTVALPDGSIVLMGGYTQINYVSNDVWHSTDKGVNWHQHATGSPWWSARDSHDSVALPDGSIVLTGGRGGSDDTWISTDKGATWTEQSATSGWGSLYGRMYGHKMVVRSDGAIILLGGRTTIDENRVWETTDNGINWSFLHTAPWTGRFYFGCVLLSDDSIVLMGGSTSCLRDVWRYS